MGSSLACYIQGSSGGGGYRRLVIACRQARTSVCFPLPVTRAISMSRGCVIYDGSLDSMAQRNRRCNHGCNSSSLQLHHHHQLSLKSLQGLVLASPLDRSLHNLNLASHPQRAGRSLSIVMTILGYLDTLPHYMCGSCYTF